MAAGQEGQSPGPVSTFCCLTGPLPVAAAASPRFPETSTMDSTWYLPNVWAALPQQLKSGMATPMGGLQTLTHGANIHVFFCCFFVFCFFEYETHFMFPFFLSFLLLSYASAFSNKHELARSSAGCVRVPLSRPVRFGWHNHTWHSLRPFYNRPHHQTAAPFCEGSPSIFKHRSWVLIL